MKDQKSLADQNSTPEDVAALYSWANLHGTKYRDFSASRSELREQVRQQQQGAPLSEPKNLARETGWGEFEERTEPLSSSAPPHSESSFPASRPLQDAAVEPAGSSNRSRLPQTGTTGISNGDSPVAHQTSSRYPGYAPPPHSTMTETAAESSNENGRHSHDKDDRQDGNLRPAWLSTEQGADAIQSQGQEDSILAARDRMASRWFALKGVFEGGPASTEVAPAPIASRPPVLAVFSLAGGVGKTSMVATLGRSLSARGERVLLVDTAAYGLLPFFFGARDQRPGVVRTFSPPGSSGDAPIQTLTVDPEVLGAESGAQDALAQEIWRQSHGVHRILVDLATASGSTARRVLRMAPTVLVPLMPDMSSVVSVGAIDAFFQHNNSGPGRSHLPFYVLNQFDPSLPLHLDVREILREQLGDRLLSFVLRRTPAVSEALAEGMTVVDYAPNSPVAEDIAALAGWMKSQAAPAAAGYRGVRWSER